jgi:hypothetical protein
MSIDQFDIKATLFEHFEQGNPVDASRLHHDSLNLTLPQPFGQRIEIGRKRAKALHRPLIAIRGHRHPMGVGPHINPRGMEIALLSLRGARPFGMTLA